MIKLSYRNKIRLKQWIKTILVLLFLLCVIVAFYLFYLQRYVIYSRDGVSFDFSQTTDNIPLVKNQEEDPADSDRQQVQIEYVENSSATGSLSKISGYYITTDMLSNTHQDVLNQIKQLTEPCCVLLDLKNPDGTFCYSTSITGAQTADIDISAVDNIISVLKSRGFTLIARIPAFADSAFALENPDCALQIAGGALWADSDRGYWLDPANKLVQDYLGQICKELSSMGFSEVVLGNFYFPTSGTISYSSNLTKAELISQSANDMKSAFTGSNLTISFCTDDTAFPVKNIAGRLYFSGTTGTMIDGIVAATSGSVSDVATQLVFLTDSHDTRFDSYSTLQPILAQDTAQNQADTTAEP